MSTNINDRFFLEEIHKHITDYYDTLDLQDLDAAHTKIRDWLSEMVKELPLTEEDRQHILKTEYQDMPYFFESEKELLNSLE